MSEQDEAAPAIPTEIELRRHQIDLDLYHERQMLDLERQRAYLEAERQAGLMERRVIARALAGSDLVPAGFRVPKETRPGDMPRALDKAAAGILLAQEYGKMLGLSDFESLVHLQVIEGTIGLRPESARARIMAAGYPVRDEIEYSRTGIPVAWTVTSERDGQSVSVRFTLDDAVRMRLCALEYATGTPSQLVEVTAVRARSERGKAKPWETATADMLCWRASGRLAKRYFSDVVHGLPLTSDLEPVEEQPRPAPEVIRELNAGRPAAPAAPEYDPARDLEITGPEWWEHANARERHGVKRRNAKQLAADRIQEYFADHQRRTGAVPYNVPVPGEVVTTPDQEEGPLLSDPESARYVDVQASGPDEPLPPEPDYPEPDYPEPPDVSGVVANAGETVRLDSEFRQDRTEDDRTRLLTLLDDYVQRTGMDRDKLTQRARVTLAAGGPVPGVEELTNDQLAEVLDVIGPMVEEFAPEAMS